MTHELWPLPEPDAYCVWWESDEWTQWNFSGDPLPTTWDDGAPDSITQHFSADKVRAYALAEVARAVAAEREACAEIAAPERIPYSDDEWRVRCEIAEAIRERAAIDTQRT